MDDMIGVDASLPSVCTSTSSSSFEQPETMFGDHLKKVQSLCPHDEPKSNPLTCVEEKGSGES